MALSKLRKRLQQRRAAKSAPAVVAPSPAPVIVPEPLPLPAAELTDDELEALTAPSSNG